MRFGDGAATPCHPCRVSPTVRYRQRDRRPCSYCSGAHPGTRLTPDASSSAVERSWLPCASIRAIRNRDRLGLDARRGSKAGLDWLVEPGRDRCHRGRCRRDRKRARFARLGSGDIQPSLCGIGAGAGNVRGAIQRLQELGSCVSPDDGSRRLFIVCSRLWLMGAAGGSVVRGHARVGSRRWLATATSGTRACPEMVCFRG